MKLFTRIFAAALLSAAALALAPAAHAQVNVNINTAPPAWGPPVPQGTQFYYIPEIDGYYDLYAQQYIVYRGGRWLPVAVIDGYDPRSFHPVVLDYRGREPWVYVRRPPRPLPHAGSGGAPRPRPAARPGQKAVPRRLPRGPLRRPARRPARR